MTRLNVVSFVLVLSLGSLSAVADVRVAQVGKTTQVTFSEPSSLTKERASERSGYVSIRLGSLSNTSDVGAPSLPFHAILVHAKPSDIRVKATLGEKKVETVGRVLPSQKELCRCPDDANAKSFVDQSLAYRAPAQGYRIESLGDFRGQPISRVTFLPHHYNAKSGVLAFYPNAQFEVEAKSSVEPRDATLYDYLIVTQPTLVEALSDWIAYKQASQGLRFKVVTTDEAGSTAAALKAWIATEYAAAGFKYALFVGTQTKIPNFRVSTTTTSSTPTDLPYFTMGGAEDFVPEVYAGRVVSDDAVTVKRILQKWIAYESDSSGTTAGWGRSLGVASNEGANPSDLQYVQSVQQALEQGTGSRFRLFFQNNTDSNPTEFNTEMNIGATWITYLGHGSGTSWPSFKVAYGMNHINQMRNATAVKPVWIDVACQNGALFTSYAGARLMDATDAATGSLGTVAYYGGTVNISWHPPAILARGMAMKMVEMEAPTLGEILQVGHAYLAANYTGMNEIRSNQQWYHLQGDPSLRVRLK